MTTTRTYDSSRRLESAATTRLAVVRAAIALFSERGWAGTSMKDVARGAGVSVETVYASVGTKAELLKVALDVAVVGDDEDSPLAERPEFRALAEGNLAERAAATGRMLAAINRRTASVYRALVHAASGDPDLAALLTTNVSGQLESNRQGLSAVARRPVTDEEAETCTAVLGPDVYLMVTRELGWTDEQYAAWVATTVVRIFDLQEES